MSFLLGRKKNKKVVLFLCTGDTCRGPMAQGYMKYVLLEKGLKNVDVRTAGVMTIAGLIPTPEAAQVMKNAEVDITGHRSTSLTHELIRKADIILGMTPFHVQFALRMSDDAKDKTYLLKEYAQSDIKNYQITDPMGATLEVYKRVYREMKLAIDKMIESKEFFTGEPEGKAPAPAPAPAKAKKPARVKKGKDAGEPAKKSTSKKKSTKGEKKEPAKSAKAKTAPAAKSPKSSKATDKKKPAAKKTTSAKKSTKTSTSRGSKGAKK